MKKFHTGWYIPVIIATWEVEAGQPGHFRLPLKNLINGYLCSSVVNSSHKASGLVPVLD